MSHIRSISKALLGAFCLCCSMLQLSADRAPRHVVFTYMGDPSTTLTANWQSILSEPTTTSTEASGEAIVYYDTVSHAGVAADYAHRTEGVASQIPGLGDRFTYRTQLTDLQPDTTYYLVVGNSEIGASAELKVKTITDDGSPLRFVTGGDMGPGQETRTLLEHAASYDPNFAVLGGDIGYANGNIENVDRWDAWLDHYTSKMVTSDGYTIPMMLAIGNHETRGNYGQDKSHAPFYFGFFGQDPEQSYFVRKFGKNLAFYVLDSGHVATHESQVEWMQTQFEANRGVKHQAAVYHVPLYPSHREITDQYSEAGRTYWSPVFDEFGLTVAFENHDHTFKRTHLLKGGEVTGDSTGTLYLGDGCWGRGARSTDYGGRWYLDAAGSVQHFWVVDINADAAVYRAVDLDNRIFDVYPKAESAAEAAAAVFASKELRYNVPTGTVRVSSIHDVDEQWSGGATTVTLFNPYDFPMTTQLTAKFPADLLQVVDQSDEAITLEPGETRVLPISFVPSNGLTVERDLIMRALSVVIDFGMADPAHAEPVHFSQTFYVPVRAKAVK